VYKGEDELGTLFLYQTKKNIKISLPFILSFNQGRKNNCQFMRRILILAPLLFFVLNCGAQSSKIDEFDHVVDSLMKLKVPGVSLLIARGGKILKEKSYGFCNLENKVPATANTKYEIASLSKPFTATAGMVLVEQGKIALDSPVSTYLNDLPDSLKIITIRQLMSHTSGLPEDHYDYLKLSALTLVRYTMKQQLKDLYSKKLLSAPGTKFIYSDGAFFLLAAIIEKITGQSFYSFTRANIFEKAGMKNSSFLNGDSILADRSQGYTLQKKALIRWSLDPTLQALDVNGFAGIISTTGDLMRWTSALSEGKIIKKESLDQMITPTRLADGTEAGPQGGSRIGLGWFVRNVENRKLISHSGHTGTFLGYFPNEKLVVVLLTNLGKGVPGFHEGFDNAGAGFLLAGLAAKKYLK
jgi:CubicO group peptidase (beta-lactamase class C family)